MKSFESVGLLAAGKVRDSFLRNIPLLAEKLGPVRSSSLRLASRICGILGAGRPADSFDAFEQCQLVLISMPEPWLPAAVDELLEAAVDWKSKTVLVCDAELESTAIQKLSFVGAATGSLAAVDGFDGSLYVAEGDRKAIRDARALVERPETRLVTIDTGHKAQYVAGLSFATSLVLPLVTAFGRDKALRHTCVRLDGVGGAWQALSGVTVEGYEIHHGQTRAVDTGAPAVLPEGLGCELCRDPVVGRAVASTSTDLDGRFALRFVSKPSPSISTLCINSLVPSTMSRSCSSRWASSAVRGTP